MSRRLRKRQAAVADWLTDGGDPQRTAWQKNEHILNVSNVKGMKLLWKYKTDNEPREMHALFPPLIVGRVLTAAGPKQVAIVAGISDNIYAIDVATGGAAVEAPLRHDVFPAPGRQLRHAVPGRPAGDAGDRSGQNTGQLHHLRGRMGRPPASARRRDRQSGRAVGAVHAAERQAVRLNLWNNVVYTTSAQGCGGNPNYVYAFDLATRRTATFDPGSGGMWGRSGPSIGKDGTVYTGTGDGSYNPELRSYGTAVIGGEAGPENRRAEAEGLLRSAERRIPAEARPRSAGDRAGVRTRGPRVARAGEQGMPHVAARHERAGRRGSFDGRASVAAHLQRRSGLPGRRRSTAPWPPTKTRRGRAGCSCRSGDRSIRSSRRRSSTAKCSTARSRRSGWKRTRRPGGSSAQSRVDLARHEARGPAGRRQRHRVRLRQRRGRRAAIAADAVRHRRPRTAARQAASRAPRTPCCTRWTGRPARSCGRAAMRSRRGITTAEFPSRTAACTSARTTALFIASGCHNER